MGRNHPTFNILMYSHDTYGLGHIRRTLAIASHLHGSKVNILILTGSPIAGRFTFPDQVDFVRIPGMIKKTNEEYLPMSIRIHPQKALEIRKSIITATAKSFRPHIFIVDKEPLGLKKEVLPTLEWLRSSLTNSRTILGLRDIMDDRDTVRADWERKGVYPALDTLYDEVWIYGNQGFYDPIREYAIPDAVRSKVHFTGYIPRPAVETSMKRKMREEHGVGEADRMILVTTGGGGDGYKVIDTYLAMLETQDLPPDIKSILVTGPFMPKRQRKDIWRRARHLGISAHRFSGKILELIGAADLVVGMGGYNTTCEILSQGTVSLLVPREKIRKEQLIRARIFQQQGLSEYIPWDAVTPQTMKEKMMPLLLKPEAYHQAMAAFEMTGIEVMKRRLSDLRETHA